MVAFARFVMRDNGLAIHINADQVTQLRQTIEGDPAIYIAGRDTPMMVEGTLEGAIRKLEAASAGLRIVEDDAPQPVMAPEPTPPAPEPPVAQAERAPSPPTKTKAKTKTKTPRKAVEPEVKNAKARSSKSKSARPIPEPIAPYPAASWFRGNS